MNRWNRVWHKSLSVLILLKSTIFRTSCIREKKHRVFPFCVVQSFPLSLLDEWMTPIEKALAPSEILEHKTTVCSWPKWVTHSRTGAYTEVASQYSTEASFPLSFVYNGLKTMYKWKQLGASSIWDLLWLSVILCYCRSRGEDDIVEMKYHSARLWSHSKRTQTDSRLEKRESVNRRREGEGKERYGKESGNGERVVWRRRGREGE